jgi:hypothetical protein
VRGQTLTASLEWLKTLVQSESFLEAAVLAALFLVLIEVLRAVFFNRLSGLSKLNTELGRAILIATTVVFILLFAVGIINIPWVTVILPGLAIAMTALLLAARRGIGLGLRWQAYILYGLNRRIWRLRSAIQREYFEEEKLDLSGEADFNLQRDRDYRARADAKSAGEGRPVIVTNFPRYSQLVEGVVNASVATCGRNEKVFCLTTLSIPLVKWFNFEDEGECVNAVWYKYLQFLESDLLRKQSKKTWRWWRSDVVVARICMVHEKGEAPNDKRIRLISADDLRRDFVRPIWITRKEDMNSEGQEILKPLSPHERQLIYRDLKNCRPDLKDKSDEQRFAYLILPEPIGQEVPGFSVPGIFSPLGEEFTKRFHSEIDFGHYHAYYAELPWRTFLPKYGDLAPPPMDCFFVSIVPNTKDKALVELTEEIVGGGVFCLAAVLDESLNMVHLHLLDPRKTPKNFGRIQNHIRELTARARSLKELVA